ncbi:hypothetical protein BU23DRAFT_44863 [Bimuria novae-zelandiae CBS 107.79]|uniref:Zn(2)-C6 fungal-type domain-containing protein n=1 Tax=Bimuria novae-zelandiae CBS 107.79 TaxID=1447943 RepID=A0A6A5VGX1_9PLEO|nr:hypothetical protein BU23DRAFT_44863 [Bimuria novae-zelandiae CBS 107.79]
MQPTKKTRSCVPCHTRKLRCDATLVGTPCTRCVTNNRVGICVLVEHRRNKNPKIRTARTISSKEPQASTDQASNNDLHAESQASALVQTGENWRHAGLAELHNPVSQEVLGVPVQGGRPLPTHNAPESDIRRIMVEYYRDFNPLTILAEGLQQPRRRGLVQEDNAFITLKSAHEREISHLDATDRAYLLQRHVHDLPSKSVCEALVDLFFRHACAYLPILDHIKFLEKYRQDNCSTLILYALFVVVIPYATSPLIRSTGYADATAAQLEFFTRTRLLFDFGCERDELSLLQCSLLLGSFQHTFDANKNSRFWFSNAVRLALQMGLHKSDIEEEVDPTTYRLLRRIWWVLIQRDVLYGITGLESTRLIHDDETDVLPVELDDFAKDPSVIGHHNDLAVQLQRLCFQESCKLARFGARFLDLFQKERLSPTMSQVRELDKALKDWQVSLPQQLNILSAASCTYSDACIVTLHLLFYQISVLFHRTVCRRLSTLDSHKVAAYKQQLSDVTAQGWSFLRQAMMQDALCFAPPFIIESIAQMIAVCIETAQKSPQGVTQAHRSDLTVFIAYFEEMVQKWSSAKLYARMFQAGAVVLL